MTVIRTMVTLCGRFRAYGRLAALVNAALFITLLFAGSVGNARAADAIRLLVLGDSLTAGYGLPAPGNFPNRLQAALRGRGYNVTVINAGVSGDTTAGGRARLAWALNDDPDAVIVELGANDALRGLEPQEAYDNLDAILTTLGEKHIPVLLTGMRAPPNLGAEYVAAFDGIYPKLAKKHGVALYPFFLDGVAARPELNQDDGIHPNAAGVHVIVTAILPAVERLIASAE